MKSFQQYLEQLNEYGGLNEAASKSLSRVHQHTQERNIGMISAQRGENTPEENNKRHKQLAGDLKRHGFGFIHVKGRFIENHGTPEAKAVDEKSYLVVGAKGHDGGALKKTLTKLGKKYNQDSVLHKAHNQPDIKEHGLKSEGNPKDGESRSFGTFHPNKMGQYHTAMKGKRSFQFESMDDHYESIYFINPVSFYNRESETLF